MEPREQSSAGKQSTVQGEREKKRPVMHDEQTTKNASEPPKGALSSPLRTTRDAKHSLSCEIDA